MAAPCTADTPSVVVTEDGGTGELSWDVQVAGAPALAAWPYDAPASSANGLRIDGTLGSGGLWTHPPAAVTVYVADPALYPAQSDSAIPVGTSYLDDGLPSTWDLVNPSPHLSAYAFVYAGVSVYMNGTGGAEANVWLQTSHDAGATWNTRDHQRMNGDSGLITFPSLNDFFTLAFDPGETRQVAARVKIEISDGTWDGIAREAIKLRAIVVAAPIVV